MNKGVRLWGTEVFAAKTMSPVWVRSTQPTRAGNTITSSRASFPCSRKIGGGGVGADPIGSSPTMIGPWF